MAKVHRQAELLFDKETNFMKCAHILTLTFVVAFVVVSATAQLTPGPCVGGTTYNLQYGDRLYEIFGPDWEKLKGPDNPGLEARTIIKADDNADVMLYPFRGDAICIPAGMAVPDIIADRLPRVKTLPIPINPPFNDFGERRYENMIIFLIVLLGALIVIAIVWFFVQEMSKIARDRELNEDPVTSAPPVVSGGISVTESDALIDYFMVYANRVYLSEVIRTRPDINLGREMMKIVRVSPIEYGWVSGEGKVGYGDYPRLRRFSTPVLGYHAMFKFPDGTCRLLIALEACMNPCYREEGMTGFTFTPLFEAVPAPRSEKPALWLPINMWSVVDGRLVVERVFKLFYLD